MITNTKLAFIGVGVMGEAVIRGLLAHDLVAPSAIMASHPRPARLAELSARYGVGATVENRAAVDGADIVLLSVKPQVLSTVLHELCGGVPSGAFVLSMIAGARISTIANGLSHRAVVRCMPNTPAQIGEGMTVWTATPEVRAEQRTQAQAVLGALGRDLLVDNEDYLDMATAVSGTGPTYVFLLMEALVDAAVHLGFSRADARGLVLQTIKGSAMFAEQAEQHPAVLRNMVTSPGGTSAAALYQLEKGSFRTVLSKAVWSAYQRSIELGQLGRTAAVDASSDGERSGDGAAAPAIKANVRG